MNFQDTENTPQVEEKATPVAYEAPAIESILTPEALEREVHYAGNPPISGAVGQ